MSKWFKWLSDPMSVLWFVGFKPSFGSILRAGVHPLASSLDHVGFFARNVDDVTLALSATSQSDPRDPASSPLASFSLDVANGLDPLGPPRLLIMHPPFREGVQPAQRGLLEAIAKISWQQERQLKRENGPTVKCLCCCAAKRHNR